MHCAAALISLHMSAVWILATDLSAHLLYRDRLGKFPVGHFFRLRGRAPLPEVQLEFIDIFCFTLYNERTGPS